MKRKRKTDVEKLEELKAKWKVLSDRRERYVNKYLIGLELRMSNLDDEIDALKKKITNKK
jgi:hypothetical protein